MSQKEIVSSDGWVPDDPDCNRSVIPEWEWVLVKDAIDTAREEEGNEAAREVLMSVFLWDEFDDCPDEKKINQFYMRNA